MNDIPTTPKLWGDLRLDQLHITGASFERRETSAGPIMVATHLTLGNKGRRWSLDVSSAYETDKHGNRLGPGPASTPPAMPGATEKETVLENRIIILKAQLTAERQEREGLYPVIDEMKRVRALLEARIAKLEGLLRQGLEVNGELHAVILKLQAETKDLHRLHCEACRRSTAGAGFPKGPCSPNCEWFVEAKPKPEEKQP